MPFFSHDGVQFHYQEAGSGLPFVFQHGLGGDVSQPFGLLQPPAGIRLLGFDARGHGKTHPVSPPAQLRFSVFGGDLGAFLDHLGIERAVIGGISMGASLSLHFALRFPRRVQGLVLSRPAWLEQPCPWNVKMFTFIAGLIRRHGARQGLIEFEQSPEYAEARAKWPDVASSLSLQFRNPIAEESVDKLEAIITDTPHPERSAWATIRVPTLLLGNRLDPIHPYEYAEELARAIPGAEFQEITSKSVDVARHGADVQRLVEIFLRRHFLR